MLCQPDTPNKNLLFKYLQPKQNDVLETVPKVACRKRHSALPTAVRLAIDQNLRFVHSFQNTPGSSLVQFVSGTIFTGFWYDSYCGPCGVVSPDQIRGPTQSVPKFIRGSYKSLNLHKINQISHPELTVNQHRLGLCQIRVSQQVRPTNNERN